MIPYYLAQKYGIDFNGYSIPINHSHLCAKNLNKSLCGLKTTNYKFHFIGFELKEWMIDKITCKKCKQIANRSFIIKRKD